MGMKRHAAFPVTPGEPPPTKNNRPLPHQHRAEGLFFLLDDLHHERLLFSQFRVHLSELRHYHCHHPSRAMECTDMGMTTTNQSGRDKGTCSGACARLVNMLGSEKRRDMIFILQRFDNSQRHRQNTEFGSYYNQVGLLKRRLCAVTPDTCRYSHLNRVYPQNKPSTPRPVLHF